MSFTALHRALGVGPGPFTDNLLDAAVAASVAETDDLDWKSELPPIKGIPQTDFPKDVAAMANSGGGVIVYGVRESQKAATGRTDVGEFDENYERSLRSAAITAISPPVFGLSIHRLGTEGSRAVVVEVPSSIDGPHPDLQERVFRCSRAERLGHGLDERAPGRGHVPRKVRGASPCDGGPGCLVHRDIRRPRQRQACVAPGRGWPPS